MFKKVLKICVFLLLIAYIPAVCFVPQLTFLKEDIMAWIIYAIAVLLVLFIFSIFREKPGAQNAAGGSNDTQEVLKERSKWYI